MSLYRIRAEGEGSDFYLKSYNQQTGFQGTVWVGCLRDGEAMLFPRLEAEAIIEKLQPLVTLRTLKLERVP